MPSTHLVLNYREIGLHRARQWGFATIFGFPNLYGVPFLKLARRVKHAYEGWNVPSHEGWPSQREALQWLIEKGVQGIYNLDPDGIQVKYTPQNRYFIADGNHRALALYILGENAFRAQIKR